MQLVVVKCSFYFYLLLRSLVAKKSQKDKDKADSCLSGLPAVAQKLKNILDLRNDAAAKFQLSNQGKKPIVKAFFGP